MPADVKWLRQARRELIDIAGYVASDIPAAAARIVRRLEHMASLLGEHPRLGPRRADLRSDMRSLTDRPYLIIYRTIPDADDDAVDIVEILYVLDGRRDLRRVLSRRPR